MAVHTFLHLAEAAAYPPSGAVDRQDEFEHQLVQHKSQKEVK